MEHAAERAGLFADVDDLAKQRRKELAGAGQGGGETVAAVHRSR